ncbi:MAG: hydroxymethylglutaryl-CoA lyase [Terriglobales bacterium]
METPVEITECPRDALQGCPRLVPAEEKIALLRLLLAAGCRRLDCASFVSPRAVPQMADSEAVLAGLGPLPAGTELIAIVLNRRGAERAGAAPVGTVGYPLSVSPTFQRQNANQTPEQALAVLGQIKAAADGLRRRTIVYISMAFGNPFGDAYGPELVEQAVAAAERMGIGEILLADTAGQAQPAAIAALFALVRSRFAGLSIGLHLHSRPDAAGEKIAAAYAAGCLRFDAATGGLGGCPFAGDHLVGNIATETLLAELAKHGARLPFDAAALSEARAYTERLREKYCGG